MRKIALHWQILIGIVAAILFGTFLREQIKYVEWFGTIFLRALKMIVVPLVLSSLISGITNTGSGSKLGRLGLKTILYYISTSLLAILTGLLLVNLFKPGIRLEGILGDSCSNATIAEKSLGDTLIEVIPTNIFEALTVNEAMLSIIFFAVLTGIYITKLKDNHRNILTGFFNAFFELMMKITMFIIKLAPIGIFGILLGRGIPIAKIPEISDNLTGGRI